MVLPPYLSTGHDVGALFQALMLARRTNTFSGEYAENPYIADVRLIARHASESTTLRYAKAHDLKVIKSRAKLGY